MAQQTIDMAISQPVIIGLAGGTGSGKTTVARALNKIVGEGRIAVLLHDAYYRNLDHLPPAQRAEFNFDHPDALDTDLLIQHIKELKAGNSIEMPIYDFKTHSRTTKTIHIDPEPVIMVEGILIFAEPELRKLFDVKIFVDTDADIRFIRRVQRDVAERGRTVESVINQYLPPCADALRICRTSNVTPTSSSPKAASTKWRLIWWRRNRSASKMNLES